MRDGQRAQLVTAIARWSELLDALEVLLQLHPPALDVCPRVAVHQFSHVVGGIPLAARPVVQLLRRLPRQPR
eukprot:2365367-Prymnesium_polylepis.1